jgi:peptidoglycan hydrolase-like protein with peptidoglycan-binding domain
VLLPVLLLGACGDDPEDGAASDATTTTLAQLIEADDAGDGDTDGHDLARGDATPTDPTGRHYLHHGDTGPDVTTLQARLVELGAPIGKPDGEYGDHTLAAVLAFQRSEGLTPDGVVGTATWAALDAPKHAITWELPDVPDEHSLDGPTGSSADAATRPTSPSTSAPARQGDGANVPIPSAPAHDPAHAGQWTKAVVTLGNQTATFYDAAGAIVFQAPISSGHDGLTPSGTFHVQSKSQRAFAGNGIYMDHMVRFNGGIGFHSIPKRASGQDLPTPLGQRPVSHGCIRMADADAATVFANLPIGALVEVHE